MVRDFGKALNSGAYLKELKRTRIGPFKLENALSVSEVIEKMKNENS